MSSLDAESSSHDSEDHNHAVYGQPGYVTGFPPTVPASKTRAPQTLYAQSLQSTGNGIPVADPWYCTESETPDIVIGDVGWFTLEGYFTTPFNIFCHPTSDDTDCFPKHFQTLNPPLSEWRIRQIPDYFPPGSIITSEGVKASRLPDSAWVEFHSEVSHGALLCLPNGGSRTDLIDVDALRPYITEHALDWYRYVNRSSRSKKELVVPNGGLFLVTGTDHTRSNWSTAVIERPGLVGRYDPTTNMWTHDAFPFAANASVHPGDTHTLGVCFIRGFSIALGSALWTHYLPRLKPSDEEHCGIRSAPKLMKTIDQLGWRDRVEGWLKGHAKKKGRDADDRYPLNILSLILQIMLAKAPSADILMVHDSLLKKTDNLDFYYPGLFDNFIHIFRHHDVVLEDGAAWMVPAVVVHDEDDILSAPDASKSFWDTLNPLLKRAAWMKRHRRDQLWKFIHHLQRR